MGLRSSLRSIQRRKKESQNIGVQKVLCHHSCDWDGGCSCHPFALSLAPAAVVGDWIGNFEGVRVLVDPETAPQIEGVEIDYVETLEGSGFTVSKPNAHRACGCGGHHHDHGSHAHDESDAPAGHGGEEA